MNTLKFEVYKNTLKRRDGFNPVLGEKNYTKIKCYFVESDWDKCTAVTANFMSDKDNIVKSTVSLTTDDKTAVFDIPSGLEGDKICFSLTGSYADDSGNTVTLNTNLVGINRQKGMLPSETVNFGLYEQMLSLYNKMNVLYNQLKAEKISKSEGSIVTAYLADGAVTKAKLSSDLNTLAGYGITDAYTKERTDQKLAQKLNSMPFESEPTNNSPCYLTSGAVYNALLPKADKASTLAGYGITDAYTKEVIDKKFARKLDSMPFDDEPKYNSPCYLTSGAVYNALLVKADKTALATKYDSSNIETGKGELTPAQATYDGCEGSFNYSKIGKTVTVALNITTLVAGKNYVQFAGLPFTAMTASKLSSIVAYTTANKLVNIRLHGSWLYISSPGTTFAEGEKINVIVTYIIG